MTFMDFRQLSSTRTLNYLSVISLIFVSGLFIKEPFFSAAEIWLISEIFNHCVLILPISAFLIYKQKDALLSIECKPSPILLIPLTTLLLVLSFAKVGDISVISHLSVFIYIPLLIVTFIGYKAAKQIAFPLLFILFAVPIGEELIPTLQQITADLSVSMLQLSNIPVYRSGLFIDIPNGKFLVAEACSGISFLISSFAFGSLYAHLNFRTTKSKLAFSLLALCIPIVANAIRVYGIIMIAYYTDMEYAVGADHLIYGWFFYIFVMLCVFYVGEYFRPKQVEDAPIYKKHASWNNVSFYKLAFILSVSVLVIHIWTLYISSPSNETSSINFDSELNWQTSESNPIGTNFNSPNIELSKILAFKDGAFSLRVGAYQSNNPNEAISRQSIVFDKKFWSSAGYYGELQFIDANFNVYKLSSSYGRVRYYSSWYIVNDVVIQKAVYAKLYETYLKLFGLHKVTSKVVASWPMELEQKNTILRYFSRTSAVVVKDN